MEKNVWNQMKKIFLPKAAKGEEAFVYVSVNERSFQVPKGQEVEVPLPVYQRLMIMEKAEKQAEDFISLLTREGEQ